MTYDNLLYEEITDELVGSFANYFCNHARAYLKPENDLLIYQSASGYFSAFKTEKKLNLVVDQSQMR